MEGPKKPSFWATLRNVKHVEWVAALLIGGLVLMLMNSIFTSQKEGESLFGTSYPANATAHEPSGGTELERRLEEVLSLVDGAGSVRVVIATEVSSSGISSETPIGVIVVAEGAGDLAVRLELARAVQSLLGVPQSGIEVLPMARGGE